MCGMDEVLFREIHGVPPRKRLGAFFLATFCVFVATGFLSLLFPADDPYTAVIVLGIPYAVLYVAAFVLIFFSKLTVTVRSESVEIKWWFLHTRVIQRSEIASVEAVTYHPIKEFGGWGVRFGRNGARCYSLWGNRAAELILKDGKRILIGSIEPEPLVEALEGS